MGLLRIPRAATGLAEFFHYCEKIIECVGSSHGGSFFHAGKLYSRGVTICLADRQKSILNQ
jgi:hypothetical protein